MATNGVGAPNGTAEWARQQQWLDQSRAEPPTYDQAKRKEGHKTDHSHELRKTLEY
ncbi:hypothetical protein ACI77J_06605 [Pseudomonas sp. O64]|uniref:hypothetical protein n=1 Tax=Pseudomonas TaxID=286 RepID=UPI001595BDFF|nr:MULTISPECIES: hypothetical protein [unclassified Pseudomonas]MCV2230844.1 hypothetical protein [Pseudomonas sp. AU10]UNM19094.1 hypothetical protein K0P33_26865 [Pseudomonas sp. ArH3a]UXZ21897.1 hypothetical protein KZH41_26040 [Pseudomonas sp. YeP6b]